MVARGVLVVVLLLSACETVRVQQSSLVPAATLPPAPRRDGVLDLYLEHSTVTFVSQPERAPTSDAGLWIARHNLQAAATVHASEHLGVRLLATGALSTGAMKAAPTTLRNPGRDASGYGTGLTGSVPLGSDRTQLHLVADLAVLSVPSFVREACDDCPDDPQRGRVDRESVLQSAFAMTATHEVSSVTRLSASAAIRNHPTNSEEFESYSVDAEVHEGPVNVVIGIGVETDILDWLALAPYVQWPVTRDPVRYGPLLGLGLRGILQPQR